MSAAEARLWTPAALHALIRGLTVHDRYKAKRQRARGAKSVLESLGVDVEELKARKKVSLS